MTLEETIENNKKWIEKQTEILNDIEKFSGEDRLEIAAELVHMCEVMQFSLMAWNQWLQQWIETLPTNEEMAEIHEFFKRITVDFLKADIEITTKMNKALEKQKVPKRKSKERVGIV